METVQAACEEAGVDTQERVAETTVRYAPCAVVVVHAGGDGDAAE